MRFFTPGPTHLAPEVPKLLERALAEHVGSISHRSKEFEKISIRMTEGLKSLLGIPAAYQIFVLGSATEGWERIIQNCSREHTFHAVNGSFSERFYTIARELGRNAVKLEVPLGQGFDLGTIAVPSDTELICLTQNETSTGVSIPEDSISALKLRYPEKLIAVDIVSSAPISTLSWTEIDCGFFSVQKCFGLPAGLGVLVVSPAALAKSDELLAAGRSTGSYHSFQSLLSFAKKNQTPETPNVLGIYLLAGMIESFLARGIETVRAEIRERAAALYSFFGGREGFEVFVQDPRFRSITVVTVDVAGGAKPLLERLAKAGFEVGAGYGKLKDSQIRIANFPMHTREQFAALLEAF